MVLLLEAVAELLVLICTVAGLSVSEAYLDNHQNILPDSLDIHPDNLVDTGVLDNFDVVHHDIDRHDMMDNRDVCLVAVCLTGVRLVLPMSLQDSLMDFAVNRDGHSMETNFDFAHEHMHFHLKYHLVGIHALRSLVLGD